jgi:hypothetical protein
MTIKDVNFICDKIKEFFLLLKNYLNIINIFYLFKYLLGLT